MHPFLLALCCTITIHVNSTAGSPIAGAAVSLHGVHQAAATTDAGGNANVQIDPGTYRLDASAKGYEGVSTTIAVSKAAAVDVSLPPVDAPTLRTIGTVTVDGRLAPISGAVPAIVVSRAAMDAMGENRVIDALESLPGATFARPDGGSSSAISVVALRGPDPSESLVALDGQLLNDGNTGDLDLSRFPVAAFSSLDVTEGLGPEDSNGSNTFGGAINLISLQPTHAPHFAFAMSGGSWGQSEAWVNATGSHGKLGYALALDDQHEAGYVNQVVPLYSTIDPACSPCSTVLGSSTASRLGLLNLSYSFAQNADVTARFFTLGDVRDMSASTTGISDGQFKGPGNESLLQNIRAYQVRGRAPLGAGELTADVYDSDNGVTIDGNPSDAAYDVTHVDRRYNAGLTWQRTFATSELAIGGYTRYESLNFLAPPSSGAPLTPSQSQPVLGQTINTFFVRGGFSPVEKLRVDAGVFASRYTTFGSDLDGRLGLVYDATPKTALRFSVGSGFRPPLLIERYQFPLSQLAQDANGVFVGQGSPNERPEHATEYELGASHEFVSSTLDVSLYRTDLRNPIEIYYPLALAQAGTCRGQTAANPVPGCVSYNSNVGNAVYEGAEVRFVQRFAPQHLFLTAMYGLNVAYPKDLTADFSNPTSGGNLVDDRQFFGIPQQQGSLELDYAKSRWHAGIQAIFRGNNNELSQGPLTFMNASVGIKINELSDFTLVGTNLFSDGAGRFTQLGAGMPYQGVGDITIPTDRLVVEPFGLRFIYTVHE